MLTEDLMREFLDAIDRAGGHLAEYLLPPRPGVDVQKLVRDGTGLELPEEARVWWSFHNGTAQEAYYRGLPTSRLIGIEEAVDTCRTLRNVSAAYVVAMMQSQLPNHPLFEVWWFPLLNRDGDVLMCDASANAQEPSPVRRFIKGGEPFDYHRIRARSMGEMVRRWIQAVDDGWYRFNEETGLWDDSYWESMSHDQKESGFL